jgi:sulfur transfer complex TusBCD TusB component (DsrH family)
MTLDTDDFDKLLSKVMSKEYLTTLDSETYIDQSLMSKGIVVTFRDSRYKKKIKLSVNPNCVINEDLISSNISKFITKLDKRITDYFNMKYSLDDFHLSGIILFTDIDVGSRDSISDYLRVMKRIGRVKGFAPSNDKLDENNDFCLKGISNGIEFIIYDLEGQAIKQLNYGEYEKKYLKSISKESTGILRVEIRLTKQKAIRACTNELVTSIQMVDLIEKSKQIFMDIFLHIVPFGDFHKKDKADEIIKKEVKDVRMKRRMLRLITLIPEKKSLILAQKALNYRNIDRVMDQFGKIGLSPVTISKRQEIKHLKNLYSYFLK